MGGKTACYSSASGGKGYHGHTLRSRQYRLVEWVDKDGYVGLTELYDYENDPDEMENIAEDCPEIVNQLSKQLAIKKAEIVQTSHAAR